MSTQTNVFSNNSLFSRLPALRVKREWIFGMIILSALIAFEIFNFSTTDFALRDFLGDLSFASVRWATILALAFCGVDFAGIARLFSSTQKETPFNNAWYLFGAWILAGTMNAILTWWGVSIALLNHQTQSSAVLNPTLLVKVVPVFVAVMVWLLRILIIGSFSRSTDNSHAIAENQPRTASTVAERHAFQRSTRLDHPLPAAPAVSASPVSRETPHRPAPKPVSRPETAFEHPEPTYHNISLR